MIKKILGLLSLVVISTTLSCSSDSDSDNNQTPTSSVTATVDGQSWASMTGGAIANVTQIDNMGESRTVLQIIGTKMDMSSITLQFPIDNLSVGTYTFNNDEIGLLTYATAGNGTAYTSFEETGSLTVSITQVNTTARTISGTFSGTLVDFDNTSSITLTNGAFNSVSYMNTGLYSNGTMSLTRNGGTSFTMDNDQSDAKYLMISQNSMTQMVSLMGYNSTLTSDFGVYNLNLPETATEGTYDLTADEGFSAGIGNSDNQAEFNVTSGSVTVTSHHGNHLAGTFSFTASNGTETVTISNGSFSITHN
ncbi:hypothetical protein FLJC2902T_14120 [Flavobacterium limnosediminis JC2902]|uniref:Lipoprotein n=1 Tax=Flavobacterium limnosediminis JC2902 TaxID=1341181 RepID=V6SWM7_9FLAO|nr:DUF6252 family protein [Flavobacterium limnosediminis]ESU28815.1 hypothetical protein FLJC2902T_14120 [Flavobacterium limnosediminis JC2902]